MEYLKQVWPQIAREAEHKDLCVFFDFDGTLAPLAENPEKANLPLRVRSWLVTLASLPERVKVAVISGRELSDLRRKVGIPGIVYSGNHGLELEGPRIKFSPSFAAEYKALMRGVEAELAGEVGGIEGVFIENKGISLSVHYRLVAVRHRREVIAGTKKVVARAIIRHRLFLRAGKLVQEIVPAREWNKGKIVLWLLARETFGRPGRQMLPLYFGDDLTDEDAFVALKSKGITVLVGRKRKSQAKYYLRGPEEMLWAIQMLVSLAGGDSHGRKKR